MKVQEFKVGPKFIFGNGSIKEISKLPIKKAYVICDPFMEKNHMVDEVLKNLKAAGAETMVFSKVVPDPTVQVVSQGVAEIKAFKPDTVIALGGGSAMDSAKAVIRVYTESEKVDKPRLIAIPTTSGSGSENTAFAVISDPTYNEKIALVDSSMVPDIAILDNTFTMSVPKAVTADAGMDVLTHCLEAYVSNQASDFSDACAEKGIALTWKYLPVTYKYGEDKLAREKMHNASSIAGIAFNNAGLGICHSLSHAIGAFFHVPHGRINAFLLPHVIAFNASVNESHETEVTKRYAQVAEILNLQRSTAKQSVMALMAAIKRMSQAFGIPNTLEDLGIDRAAFEKMIPEMAKRVMADACTPTNPRPVTLKDIETIYRGL
ncbi:1-propanol dehydrogenase PduQ [Streptococcus iniae]|uniref:1-propanol dehydrogenase PduQ n=1 Tax=Streptococcus iniae TaxID=1346 RepID=UPI0002830FF3|nr:1-propanol dehydrogenase PduQ [Streptococcus iniae]AGM98038.1 iron-containing alcohol dehydrogenase [Streptococcus iniae SF1]AJG25297.1 alcohol dehydrogenase [Streptococcus iniae]APD31171.1 alcohol dehydrogenase [Streptococcus iniae]ASL34091.1 iron-containing alcohol dehydrogenase [Streptococcus iniae]ATX39023.1 Aldehyde-alcohol dehydrogenase [Streptococcus iniae]